MKAKKSLGQNFLTSHAALGQIVGAGELNKTDTVLEVGPGKGVLTRALLESAGKVIAVEADIRLVEVLKEEFKEHIASGKLVLIHDDILTLDILKNLKLDLKNREYKLIANIPYYITGELLRLFLSGNIQPERMVLLLQKEVVDRVVARDEKESILSISVKAYGTPERIAKVPRRYFRPEPNVDSAILAITNISKNFFESISEDRFFEIVKAGFAHKRKRLLKNLEAVASKEKILSACGELDIEENTRAEDVNIEMWKRLVKLLK